MFVILMGKLLRKIFFGQLRAAEMEVSYSTTMADLTVPVCIINILILILFRTYKVTVAQAFSIIHVLEPISNPSNFVLCMRLTG